MHFYPHLMNYFPLKLVNIISYIVVYGLHILLLLTFRLRVNLQISCRNAAVFMFELNNKNQYDKFNGTK